MADSMRQSVDLAPAQACAVTVQRLAGEGRLSFPGVAAFLALLRAGPQSGQGAGRSKRRAVGGLACCGPARGTPFSPSRSARAAGALTACRGLRTLTAALRHALDGAVQSRPQPFKENDMAVVSNFSFLTDAQFELLLANGLQSRVQVGLDPLPVVKLFTPDAGATWLLSEIDPEDHDIAF